MMTKINSELSLDLASDAGIIPNGAGKEFVGVRKLTFNQNYPNQKHPGARNIEEDSMPLIVDLQNGFSEVVEFGKK